MKNQTRVGLTSVFCIVLLSAACSKDDGPSRTEVNEKLLAGTASKTWMVVSSLLNNVENLPECVGDDDWIFKRNYEVSRRNVTASCGSDLDNVSSSWRLNNDGKWLTFFGGTYEILSLTENEMKLKFGDGSRTIIDTFIKK